MYCNADVLGTIQRSRYMVYCQLHVACKQAQDCSHWLQNRPCTGQCLIASAAQFHPQNRHCLMMPVMAPHIAWGSTPGSTPHTPGGTSCHSTAGAPAHPHGCRCAPHRACLAVLLCGTGSPWARLRPGTLPVPGTTAAAACCTIPAHSCAQQLPPLSQAVPRTLLPPHAGCKCAPPTPSRSQTSPQGGCTARLVRCEQSTGCMAAAVHCMDRGGLCHRVMTLPLVTAMAT
jgi:hypothetical protein